MSYWIMNIPKDDFKRKMKAGDVVTDINKARELINKYGTESQEADWLHKHVEKLAEASRLVSRDVQEEKESKFVKNNFDTYYDEDQSGMVEPAVSEV